MFPSSQGSSNHCAPALSFPNPASICPKALRGRHYSACLPWHSSPCLGLQSSPGMLLKCNTKLSITKSRRLGFPPGQSGVRRKCGFRKHSGKLWPARLHHSMLSFIVPVDDQSGRCTAKVESWETFRIVLPRSSELWPQGVRWIQSQPLWTACPLAVFWPGSCSLSCIL